MLQFLKSDGEKRGSMVRRGAARRGRIIAAAAVAVVFAAPALDGETWDGGGSDNNWSTPGNWTADNVPDGSGEAALFTDHPVGQTKLTPNLSADVTIGQLQFSATSPSYTITGSGPATLFLSPNISFGGVGVIVASGAADQAITAAEVEFLSSQTWDIGGTTTLLVTGTIEDAPSPDYALTKNGSGTLVFPGDVRYDGPTTVNAGTLILSFNNTSMLSALTVNAGLLRATTSANALGSSSTRNTITLAGGALELANNTGLTFGSTSRNTIISGNATIRSDRLTTGAGVTHTMGTLRIGAQTLSVTAGAFVNSGTAGMNFGTTTLTANGAALNVASGANLTLGALSGNFAFTKQGSGQLTLNTAANANRTSAGVTLSSGTMKLGNVSALGTASVPLALNGGTLDLAINGSVNAHNTTVGGSATIASNRSTGGSGITHTLGTIGMGTHTLSVTAGANATSGTAGITLGAATLSGNATFDVVNSGGANAQLTLGAIGQSGGVRSLTKIGAGTMLLSGTANTYSGVTTVSGGVLLLGKSAMDGAVPADLIVNSATVRSAANEQIAPSGTVALNGGSVLDLNGFTETIGNLSLDGGAVTTGAGTLVVTGGIVQSTSAASTISGRLDLGGAVRTITCNDVPVSAIDLDIAAQIVSGGIVKQGAGTLRLSGNSTFAGGVHQQSGTLLFDAVQDLSTLVVDGGRAKAGAASLLHANAMNVNISAALEFEIGGLTAGSGFGQLNVTGNASLAGTLDITRTGGFEPQAGQSFVIMTYGSRSGAFDQVTGMAAGPGKVFHIQYNPANLTLLIGPPAPGDFDIDGDVDGDDFNIFQECAAGAARPYAPTCTLPPDGNGHIAVDFDQDADADGDDFGVFQRCFGGTNRPPDQNCAT